jgi:predicted TIM-barrel fold metal-dependent hydrolase
MCLLHISAQSDDRFFEVSSEEVGNAVSIVEDAVRHVLIYLFSEGKVDDVKIHFASRRRRGLQHCAIQIHAQCSCQRFERLPRTRENMEIAVENSLAILLREIFGSVTVGRVTLKPVPSGYDPALPCCM